jgi:hypothetical protein
VTATDPSLETDAIPRCCRVAHQTDVAAGLAPAERRPLDPSGRYVQCESCVPGSRNVPDLGPPRPYVPATWTTLPPGPP